MKASGYNVVVGAVRKVLAWHSLQQVKPLAAQGRSYTINHGKFINTEKFDVVIYGAGSIGVIAATYLAHQKKIKNGLMVDKVPFLK